MSGRDDDAMLDHATPDAGPDRAVSAAAARTDIVARLRHDGFGIVGASEMRRLVEAAGGRDWDHYAATWDELGPDRFMADGGTYRKRRFACLAASAGTGLRLKPPQPHFQTRDNNPLNGGIARVFAPVPDATALHPINRAIVETCRNVFEAATAPAARTGAWHVEMHQFRIEARPGLDGQPTPEGLHRDGVDWVLVMMVKRENVGGGATTIAGPDRRPLRAATLAEPFDATFLDDRRVFHGVGPIRPLDPSRPAFRDVLVITFRAETA